MIHLTNLNSVRRETTHAGDPVVNSAEDVAVEGDDVSVGDPEVQIEIVDPVALVGQASKDSTRNSVELSEQVSDLRLGGHYGVSAAMGSSNKGDDSKQIKLSETSVIDSDR